MKLKNEIMLITYGDSMGKNLKELNEILEEHFSGAIGGVHILPFFPSSADRGFAPLCYDRVDEKLGDFADVKRLGERYYLMFDFMVNHISKSSEYYRDFMEKKELSAYRDFFIRYSEFWEGGEPTDEQVEKIYKRKPAAPYIIAEFADGSREKLWCTFSGEQIDLDVTKQATKDFIRETITGMCERGASLIRLDAFAYAVKKPDTSCFFIEPDIWELLRWIADIAESHHAEVLPEMHEHYSIQLKLAERGFWVYDFALPLLTLHALYSGRADRLAHWLTMCPKKQFTTLDTHDGIGVVDAADLLSPQEIEETKEYLFSKGANVKRVYNTAEYQNLDIYQINCTYYSALGNNDRAYLLARAIQFFAPGIPQVYYVGLLAGENDIALLEETKEGRNINRRYYTRDEVAQNVRRPVVQSLLRLMRFRNCCPAFDGDISVESAGSRLRILRRNGAAAAELEADLATHEFHITENGKEVVVCTPEIPNNGSTGGLTF